MGVSVWSGQTVEVETTAVKAVVYDLPSENQRVLADPEVKRKVRSVRVWSITLLHRLGVACTESVVLVPPSRAERIEATVNRVLQLYRDLEDWVTERGIRVELEPIIRVLSLSNNQARELLPIAERRLLETIDNAIDRVSRVLDEIREITDENRRRRVRYGLNRLSREIDRLYEVARELGIDITRDYEYLVQLIDQAINETV